MLSPKSSGAVWDVAAMLYSRTTEVKAEGIPQAGGASEEWTAEPGTHSRGRESSVLELVPGGGRRAEAEHRWKQTL